jgi:hypothetical protein
MTNRSTHAAERAASAALNRHPFDTHERYLVVDDTDEAITRIICVIRECSPRTH